MKCVGFALSLLVACDAFEVPGKAPGITRARVSAPLRLRAGASPRLQEVDWKAEVAEDKSIVPVAWGWTCNAALLGIQTYMVSVYAPSFSIPLYVGLQIVCIAYSWFACKEGFVKFPTIAGIPYFLLAFTPAFLICAVPFLGPMGAEFASNVPIWVLCAWSAVRLMFESIVQLHAANGVKGVSEWLKWPIQKADAPYTVTYPIIGEKTRTNGGNLDAFSSLTVLLPTALVCFLINNDANPIVQALSWAAQLWIFVYLIAFGPVPHFLGGMPGEDNIFKKLGVAAAGEPKDKTGMHALTYGTLGTCCYFIASYAVIHFIVFVRKMTGM